MWIAKCYKFIWNFRKVEKIVNLFPISIFDCRFPFAESRRHFILSNIAHKNLQTASKCDRVIPSYSNRRKKHKIKNHIPLRGYRKSQEIGKCLINTLKMALNSSNKKYYMASLDELTFSLDCFKRFPHMYMAMATLQIFSPLPTPPALYDVLLRTIT